MKKYLLTACLFGTLSHVSAADVETVAVVEEKSSIQENVVTVADSSSADSGPTSTYHRRESSINYWGVCNQPPSPKKVAGSLEKEAY